MIEQLDLFLESLEWPMTPPPAYGWFHILYTLIGFAVCGFLAWKLRKVSDKAARWILFSIGLALAISEVYKQLFYFFVVGENTYKWGDFPFQFCSMPLYICLIAPWLKPGKIQRGMYSFIVLFNLLGGSISFVEPSGLFHSYWFLTCHALAWHMILVFVGLFLCFSGRGGTEKGDYKVAAITFLVLCGVAMNINGFVQDVIGGSINMFFVGPGVSSLVVFKQIGQTVGWVLGTEIYIFAVCLGAFLIHKLILFVKTKASKKQ